MAIKKACKDKPCGKCNECSKKKPKRKARQARPPRQIMGANHNLLYHPQPVVNPVQIVMPQSRTEGNVSVGSAVPPAQPVARVQSLARHPTPTVQTSQSVASVTSVAPVAPVQQRSQLTIPSFVNIPASSSATSMIYASPMSTPMKATSSGANKKMTRDDIKANLDLLGVSYKANASKKELEDLYNKNYDL